MSDNSEYMLSDEQINEARRVARDGCNIHWILGMYRDSMECAVLRARISELEAEDAARYEQHLGILEHREAINNKYIALFDGVQEYLTLSLNDKDIEARDRARLHLHGIVFPRAVSEANTRRTR